jgi:glycosyltransferase involved in cell wall biosynthesis
VKIPRLLGISPGGYSGVRDNLFPLLEKRGNEKVDVIDSNLPSIFKAIKWYNFSLSYLKALYLLKNFPHHNHWLTIAQKRPWIWKQKTLYCERFVRKYKDEIDIIFQIGRFHAPSIKKPEKPYVIYMDGTLEMSQEYPLARLWFSDSEKNERKKLDEMNYQNATRILAMSECARRSILENYEVEKEKVKTVYAGANIKSKPEFAKNYGSKLLLFVGIDFHRKGGWILLKAFKKVKKEIPKAELVIVGSRPKINQEGLTIKGRIPWEKQSQLMDLYKRASIFVMPSIQENFGHVFLEAMAYKTPCVGTKTGGVPEIIEDKVTGFLVQPYDDQTLAEKIITLLEDETSMKKMGERGQKRFEKYFTWDIVAKDISQELGKI